MHQLLSAGRLVHGSRVTVTIDGRTEPEAATTVDVAPIATTDAQPGDRVRVFVDVVRPGHGLVTADDFSGQIIRENALPVPFRDPTRPR